MLAEIDSDTIWVCLIISGKMLKDASLFQRVLAINYFLQSETSVLKETVCNLYSILKPANLSPFRSVISISLTAGSKMKQEEIC